ncbi:MAG: hypothetical protein KGM99_05610 [Burkholderiales bacterium]|nr:hypothetical protein [Burkholderiales bacterium]
MAITSYSELVTAICDRMNDDALSTYAPEFIALAEAQFTRRLKCLDMEGSSTIAVSSTVALPTDYKKVRSIHLDDYGPLRQLSPDDFQTKYADDSAAQPVDYAIFSGVIHFGPTPDAAYTVTMTYLRTLTGLSSTNTTNWILEKHPDLYLYGSLIHAEFRGWNDARLPTINSAVEQIIAEINMADAESRRGEYVGEVSGTYF